MSPNLSLLLLLGITVTAYADDEPPLQRVDIAVAIIEMQEANYYTFVTLIQMLQDSIPENATFLMPSDRILARVPVDGDAISEFVRSHIIPSPLMYGQLKHFPSGSLIPTYYPSHMLRISTHNRRVLLNGIQIVSPNFCTAGSSIRCHGINGVLVHTSESDTPATPNPPSTGASPPSQTATPNPPSTGASPPSQTATPNPPSTGASPPSQTATPNPPSTGASPPSQTATPNISPAPAPAPPSAEQDGAPSPTMNPQSAAPTLIIGPQQNFVAFISCAVLLLSVIF